MTAEGVEGRREGTESVRGEEDFLYWGERKDQRVLQQWERSNRSKYIRLMKKGNPDTST